MKKNILLVDDDEALCNLLAEIISESGFNYDLASNGKIAFDLYVKNKYDLIVTDMKMPVMDGRELIETIRSDKKDKPIPILITSAYIGVNEVKDLLDIGATYFLNKPFDKNDIIEYVNKGLGLNG